MKNATIKFLTPTLLILALAAGAVASTTSKRALKSFDLSGRVLKVDKKDRTLLVAETDSDKLYIVKVPEGAHFKITFGINMRYEFPELKDVVKNDRIRARCTRDNDEHYARLEDGRVARVLIAASN